MGKRLIADSIYIAVYTDKDGKECFAFWGNWDNRRIRWYKSREKGEREVDIILRKEENRSPKPPENTRIVRFQMEVDCE